MKKGWTYKKLGELYPIIMGKTPPRNMARFWDTKKETHNLWVSIADLSKNEGKEITDTKEYISDEAVANITKIAKGSLLVSFKLTLGKMAFAGDDLYTNEAIMSLGKRDDINLKFLYYYFSSLDWGKLAAGNEKVKGKTLNKKSLSEVPVAYLPLSEQQRIVSRLDAAFAHIDELKANAEKQLSEARALFQKALEKAMEPKEGWEEKKLGDVYDVRDGTHESPKYQSSGYPLVTSKNLRGGILDMTNINFISEKDYNSINIRSKVDIGDVLFAMIGTIGNPVLVTEEPKYAIKNMALFKVPSSQSGDFLRYYLMNEKTLSKMLGESNGTTQKFVPLKYLRNFSFKLPSLSEQRRIVARLDSLSENVKKLEDIQRKVISECDALKQALLRKVFE